MLFHCLAASQCTFTYELSLDHTLHIQDTASELEITLGCGCCAGHSQDFCMFGVPIELVILSGP